MSLDKKDKEFRFDAISYVDFKFIEMDRVLTNFFPLIFYQGYPNKIMFKGEKTVADYTNSILEDEEFFINFRQHPEIVTRWVETDLLDLVNRGKKNQAVSAPRPLHGSTYRFRNEKKCRDYYLASQLYSLLHHARQGKGESAINYLKNFFFEGFDTHTGKIDKSIILDVETQAILRFVSKEYVQDHWDTKSGNIYHHPLCIGAADLLADDIIRLLVYRNSIPRSVMVEYLKILFAFHLSLYHIRLLKLLPQIIKSSEKGNTCTITSCPVQTSTTDIQTDCFCKIGLLVDMTLQQSPHMQQLAEKSAGYYYQKIPAFIKSYFMLRKLNEFNEDLIKRSRRSRIQGQQTSVQDLLPLMESTYKDERKIFFGQRISRITQNMDEISDDETDPIISSIISMGLDEFETYIEILVAIRGNHHRKYIIDCLDSLMLKNHVGALLNQSRTRNAPRRFTIESKLLEVLLQIAVLQSKDEKLSTQSILIDDLISFLQNRYGIYIDELPLGEGFYGITINDRQALRENSQAFKRRLQEIGFYRDLSDASITQTVTPRYTISDNDEVPNTLTRSATS